MSIKPPAQPSREDVCEKSTKSEEQPAFSTSSELWRKSLWIWFVIIGALLALNAIFSEIVFRELSQQRRIYLKNRQVQVNFVDYLSALKDVEAGQRGYLITGEKAYLRPYDEGLKKLSELNKRVIDNLTEDSSQREILTGIFEQTGRKLQEVALTIDAYNRSGRPAAEAIVNNEQGRILMDEISASVNRIIRQQEAILTQIADRSARIRRVSFWLSLITSVSGIVFLGILYLYTRKTLHQRTALLKAQQIASERISEALKEKEKAFNELSQVNKVKDEFLAIVSHELRTPLNAILGWATLLKEGASPEEYSEGLLSIERNARSQSLLIEDLLDVSRVVTGKIRLQVGNVDLREIAQAVAESAKPALDAKQIDLEMRLYEKSPVVLGDSDRLQQVAWNLLSNAIKFTPKGGKIIFSVEQIASYMALIVQDNGRGISREFLPQIFNRFTQADTSTTREQGGLGLGLAIVKHIIELHGGRVYAGSEGLGKGATFKIEIPITAINQAASSSETPDSASTVLEIPGEEKLSSPDPARLPDLKGVRVFLVDDQPDTLRVLSNVLIRCGAEIHTADTAARALEAIVAVKPHVLVSDIGLPDMDGHALIGKVRLLDQANLDIIPALALTAFARSQDRINALEAGFNDHLAKPADALEFGRRVGRLAGRY